MNNTTIFDESLSNYTLRESQIKTNKFFEDNLKNGKTVFICDLPPGTGKSIISVLFMKKYHEIINSTAKFDLLTCTKNLQVQYMESFDFMNNLWGKNNYQCDKWDSTCEYGKACNEKQKSKCENCPHENAIKKWVSSPVSLTNFHIHGLLSLYQQKVISDRDANALIIDEAHSLEPTINGFVSFTLNRKFWLKFTTAKMVKKWDKVVFNFTIPQLINWIENDYITEIDVVTKFYKKASIKSGSFEKIIKLLSELSNAKNAILNFLEYYKKNPSDWIINKTDTDNVKTWNFQPLWSSEILKTKIWSNYEHLLLMSGTILDIDLFCKINGIDINTVAYLKLDTTFPAEKRPVYYAPVGKMTYNNKEECWKKMKPYVLKILEKYKGQKGIIHCGNYEIWEWMRRDIRDKRLLFASPLNRQESLNEHMTTDVDTVLVSPSMTQGVDLKDDLSRFQVVLKMPYPNLGSKVNKIRFETNKNWYPWATIIDLIQAYGRSIRNDTDYADTIILDECFGDLFKHNKDMFPQYFIDVVKKIELKK